MTARSLRHPARELPGSGEFRNHGAMKRRRLLPALALATAALFTTAGTAGPANAALETVVPPLGYHGDAGQLVTVVADGPSATIATLDAWQRTPRGWRQVIGPVKAYVGTQGIGKASETTSHTPAGVWTLTEGFGNLASDGTRLPYRQVDTSDWWVSDVKSPAYNTHQRCSPGSCPFDESAGEDLGKAGHVYDHAVVIDYNRHPAVPGAGSAFFLHVSGGKPTAGCVSIPALDLRTVMAWLDPAQHPVIDIGVR